ncbi:MAG: hypothetical protein KDJ67_11795 [Nitratireductor sp.]|nr:hypothetical protein [Nitratireductor sp.]
MPLQNRVAPDGSLHSDRARGMFTGNRGIIHDPATKTLSGRRWSTPAWICCSLKFGERKREVWGRNHFGKNGPAAGWSELFFCDEVTALAAGHRPCFFCRREDAKRFIAASAHENARSCDNALHQERWLSSSVPPQRLSAIDLPGLPDGTVIKAGEQYFALKDRKALEWDFSGYGRGFGLGELLRQSLLLVSPSTMVNALRSGYRPVWHATALT